MDKRFHITYDNNFTLKLSFLASKFMIAKMLNRYHLSIVGWGKYNAWFNHMINNNKVDILLAPTMAFLSCSKSLNITSVSSTLVA